MTLSSEADAAKTIKQCCARLYESDFAKFLLGDSFHPGGLALTERLGNLLGLTTNSRVLDVASGTGTSALFLAERFGCPAIGVDYSRESTERARELAREKGLWSRVRFETGDAEVMPFPDETFDAIVCECAFCTFPNKSAAVAEFMRVLRPGGRVGISDLTRAATLPKELDSLLARVACIADAQTIESYGTAGNGPANPRQTTGRRNCIGPQKNRSAANRSLRCEANGKRGLGSNQTQRAWLWCFRGYQSVGLDMMFPKLAIGTTI
jgi:arsenite methyltransferase